MAAYIVYNGFWNAVPPDPAVRLHAALTECGVTAHTVPNTALAVRMDTAVTVLAPDGTALTADDFMLFWDKDTRLAFSAESAGVRVYNSAAAVARCDDKSETHRVLAQAGIPMPQTFVAPMTYTEITAPIEPFLNTAEQALGYPMVLKECYGSFGNQVFLVHNREELSALAYTRSSRPFLLQHFVSEAAGEDVRLYVVGDRVVAAMKRRSATDFRANLGRGGTAEAYAPTAEEAALAERVCRLLGLQFGGVDLLHSHKGPLVCEVNSNAHMAGLIACTGVNVAREIAKEILRLEEERKSLWNS